MNYVKLKLNEKEWGAKLGLGLLRYLDVEVGIKIEEVDSMLQGARSLIGVPNLIYHAIKLNCRKSKETFNYTEEDVVDWIDDDGGVNSPAMSEFVQALTESLSTNLEKKTPQKKVAKK